MPERMIKYNLPEWTFLNADCPECSNFGKRTIFLHFPSFTILEVIPAAEIMELTITAPVFQFLFTDRFGKKETLQFYPHCTLSNDLNRIFQDSALWYCNYLRREESNTWQREKSKQN